MDEEISIYSKVGLTIGVIGYLFLFVHFLCYLGICPLPRSLISVLLVNIALPSSLIAGISSIILVVVSRKKGYNKFTLAILIIGIILLLLAILAFIMGFWARGFIAANF